MNIPKPPAQYSATDQQLLRGAIDKADKANVKQGGDYETGKGKVYLTDTVDGSRWYLTVTSGVLGVTAA